jgi:ectoine hydroxylase
MAKGVIADEKSNDPFKESHHPRYTPLIKVPDGEIVKAGDRRFAESADESAVWLDVNNDASATQLASR